jgi:voltage-gated sodium channel
MRIWWRIGTGSLTATGPADEDSTTTIEIQASAAEPRWRSLARFVDSEGFQIFIGGVIVLNAVVLGLETYSGVMAKYSGVLNGLNGLFYGIFLVELVLRILSYGTKPWNFFRHGWNIFDFIVIGGALLPFVREQATVLRLLRLARIVRLMRFLPDARILLSTVSRATPAVISMVVLTILVLFVYGILGWTLFGAAIPDQWGNVGDAMLTLFVLLTLEEFPAYLAEAQQVSPLATVFFLSYVLIAAFIIVNLLIGIVLSSMERAREEEAADARKTGQTHRAFLLEQITAMRKSLDEIEGEVDRSSRD